MNTEEYLDIYDSTGKPTGLTKLKSQVHREGLWHRTFHCWIIYKEKDGSDMIVIQKRASKKINYPDKLDITAAGHLKAGEGIEGGLREIREEIGLSITVDKLISVGVRVCVGDFQAHIINREFQDVFFLKNNTPISEYKIQEEEIYGMVSIQVDEGLKMFAGEIEFVKANGIVLEKGITIPREFVIRKEDFVPTLDNYYYKILILAKRILANEKHLLI